MWQSNERISNEKWNKREGENGPRTRQAFEDDLALGLQTVYPSGKWCPVLHTLAGQHLHCSVRTFLYVRSAPVKGTGSNAVLMHPYYSHPCVLRRLSFKKRRSSGLSDFIPIPSLPSRVPLPGKNFHSWKKLVFGSWQHGSVVSVKTVQGGHKWQQAMWCNDSWSHCRI